MCLCFPIYNELNHWVNLHYVLADQVYKWLHLIDTVL